MKTIVFPHTIVPMILCMAAPLQAQNLVSNSYSPDRFSQAPALVGHFDVPAHEKAEGMVSDHPPLFTAQDALTLDNREGSARSVDSVVDLDVLRNPSPYRKVAVSNHAQPYEVSTDSLESGLARISAIYRESGTPEKSADCLAISLSVEQSIRLDPAKVLEIVELETGANPGCACEIVKTAIKTIEADTSQVVAIVEAAIHASPESMRIISQCAIAAMPDSIAAVQGLLARLDPNAGDTGYSSKSAKSAKSSKSAKGEVASITAPPLPNPLDLPPGLPPLTPPPIVPPLVTQVNP